MRTLRVEEGGGRENRRVGSSLLRLHRVDVFGMGCALAPKGKNQVFGFAEF